MAYKKHIGVIGVGHVGLPTALGFAELGYKVIGADEDKDTIAQLRSGKTTIFEPRVDELLVKHLKSGSVRFTDDLEETVRSCEVLFVCVGTPQKENGEADLSQVESVVRLIAKNINDYKLIVEKSTVPVRTAQWIQRSIQMYKNGDHPFDVASNPEFLQEGRAIHDLLNPDRIVLGVESERARDILKNIYEPFGDRVLITDVSTAELIKHAANSFLSLKISFINMVADLCDVTGADVKEVAKGIGLDPRIGPSFLEAGIGYGGYCLPKDLRAFVRIASEHGVDFSLLEEADSINRERVTKLLKKLQQVLWVIKGKLIGILGLSFKPNTDDIREAPSLKVIKWLLEEGASLRLYDPQAMENVKRTVPEKLGEVLYTDSPYEAAKGSHALLIITEWDEFLHLDFADIKKAMAAPIIIDGRNCLDAEKVKSAGLEYYGMGRS